MNTRWKPSVTVAAVITQSFDGVEKFLLVEEETRDGLCLNNPAGSAIFAGIEIVARLICEVSPNNSSFGK